MCNLLILLLVSCTHVVSGLLALMLLLNKKYILKCVKNCGLYGVRNSQHITNSFFNKQIHLVGPERGRNVNDSVTLFA